MTDVLERYGWIGGPIGTMCLIAIAGALALDPGSLRDRIVFALIALGAAAWAACLVGCGYVHGRRDNLSLWSGISVAAIGLVAWAAGWAGFFVADTGSGRESSMTGLLVYTVIALGAIGVVMGLAVFGAGTVQAKVLPRWGRITPLAMAASLPLAALVNRLRDERSILLNSVAFLVFLLGWVVLGVATRVGYMSSLDAAPPEPPSA